jgi:hypothetical protein
LSTADQDNAFVPGKDDAPEGDLGYGAAAFTDVFC